jgi:hypothetical protein
MKSTAGGGAVALDQQVVGGVAEEGGEGVEERRRGELPGTNVIILEIFGP